MKIASLAPPGASVTYFPVSPSYFIGLIARTRRILIVTAEFERPQSDEELKASPARTRHSGCSGARYRRGDLHDPLQRVKACLTRRQELTVAPFSAAGSTERPISRTRRPQTSVGRPAPRYRCGASFGSCRCFCVHSVSGLDLGAAGILLSAPNRLPEFACPTTQSATQCISGVRFVRRSLISSRSEAGQEAARHGCSATPLHAGGRRRARKDHWTTTKGVPAR